MRQCLLKIELKIENALYFNSRPLHLRVLCVPHELKVEWN